MYFLLKCPRSDVQTCPEVAVRTRVTEWVLRAFKIMSKYSLLSRVFVLSFCFVQQLDPNCSIEVRNWRLSSGFVCLVETCCRMFSNSVTGMEGTFVSGRSSNPMYFFVWAQLVYQIEFTFEEKRIGRKTYKVGFL